MAIESARLRACAILAVSLTAVSACHRQERVYIEDDDTDSASTLVSSFKMYEPAASRQLMGGFYDLEANSWRWTARDFVIDFKTPPLAATRGATLSFSFVIPDVVIRKVPAFQLAAAVHGRQIGVQNYTAAGPQTFTAAIPRELCGPAETVVDFHIPKVMPPSDSDKRELGVIATAAALRAE